jgi:broad specificity phosphatase PhoE
VALDEVGRRQAVLAADAVGVVDAIWSSDLQRAWWTAQIIAEVIGIGPVQIDPRLREHDVGPWEGLTLAEVEAGWPDYLATRRRPEGFESFDDTAQRVRDSLIDIATLHPGGEVLAVTHGGTMRALLDSFNDFDPAAPRAPRFGNLAGVRLEVEVDPVGAAAAFRVGEIVELLDHDDRVRAADVL